MRYVGQEETRALSMGEAIRAVESAYRRLAAGSMDVPPRSRVRMGSDYLWLMPALDLTTGWSSVKVAFGQRRHLEGGVIAWAPPTGAAVAVDIGYLGGLRTGATLAVAITHLAAREARTASIIGTGRLAPWLLEGLRASRPDIIDITAYSRHAEQLHAFAERSGTNRASSAAECFEKDIVIVGTTSRESVVPDADVRPGTLVCGVGANWRDERELPDTVVARMDRIVCDFLPQARIEAADVIEPIERGLRTWSHVAQLGDVVAGIAAGRSSSTERIFFKSVGVGLEDLAVIEAVLNKVPLAGEPRA